MSSFRSFIRCAALAATLVVGACGGGGGSASPPVGDTPDTTDTTGTPAPAAGFVAVASSAHSVSLGWNAGTAAATIERRSGSADYVPVATLEAGATVYVDEGLAKNTTYGYRLVSSDGRRAEHSVTTVDEEAVVTPVGTPVGAPASIVVAGTGGQATSPDGQVTLEVRAGAYSGDVSLQAITNTAPDGRDDGVRVRLAGMPAGPLRVRMRYGAELDLQADGLRLALQRADGSWLSLPPVQVDKATRTIAAEVPPELIAPAGTAKASALSARGQATSISIEFHIVKYLAYYLTPRTKTIEVDHQQEMVPVTRVRGYEITIERCVTLGDGIEGCLPMPVMETRVLPLRNGKAGFARKWMVFLQEGGDATYGTIVPHDDVGATYTAPHRVPDPRTVTVAFESVDTATNRRVVLASAVTIVEDTWTGTMSAVDGPSDAGTSIIADAFVTWHRDDAGSGDAARRYHPEGTLGVAVTDDDCTVGVSPSVQDVSQDPRLAMLEIDDSVSPATYKARLITFWNASMTASCPKASTTGPLLAGWGWDVQGTVSNDGTTIQGRATQGTATIEWKFTRK
jgi:hypothetical protein